jgi:hypothetical protein
MVGEPLNRREDMKDKLHDDIEKAFLDCAAVCGVALGSADLDKCKPDALRRVSSLLLEYGKQAQKSNQHAIKVYEKVPTKEEAAKAMSQCKMPIRGDASCTHSIAYTEAVLLIESLNAAGVRFKESIIRSPLNPKTASFLEAALYESG